LIIDISAVFILREDNNLTLGKIKNNAAYSALKYAAYAYCI
jgi:hypothetical protein